MSGRRTSAAVPQPRPRVRNDSKVVAFSDDDAEMPTTNLGVGTNKLRADIYVPPQIQKGLVGRDGAGEYNPYSPSPAVDTPGSSVRYWPQPMSNHRPIVMNNNNTGNDMASMDSNTVQARIAITAAKRKMKQIDALKKKAEIIKQRPANLRPRGKGLHYSESSDDEQYNAEYRDLDDECTASYLRTQSTMDTVREDDDNNPLSPDQSEDWNNRKENQQDRLGFITKSISENATFETNPNNGAMSFDDNDSFFVKASQPPVFCVIAVTSIQLLVLMLQLAMCGFAPLDINPTVGPFPDAFSEWGGKNPYLTLHNNQWWRLITPAFLHVGVAHLVVNIYCQINACTMFEREWGSSKWLFLYLASEIGCSVFSNLFDPDSIAVGSTGALMGLFAAKLSQVVTFSLFETKSQYGDAIQLHQLSSILCGLTLASLMGALTYIDFSGNLGGLVSGFFAGIYVFSSCIQGCCGRFWWMLIGLAGLVASFVVPLYFFISVEPDERLSDICEYFRSFHPEGYDCGCLWD